MARPEIPIDGDAVKKFAQLGCTVVEIAAFFEVSNDTIERRFAAELRKGRAESKLKLRQIQMKAADRGNIAMMIWLGKQMLGQTDKTDISITKISDEDFMAEAQRRLDLRIQNAQITGGSDATDVSTGHGIQASDTSSLPGSGQ